MFPCEIITKMSTYMRLLALEVSILYRTQLTTRLKI